MRRRYTPEEYRKIVVGLRESRPDVAITTDVIVGTPGESESDFRQTLALVRELQFVDSFCFKYSPRPGTAAAEAPDPVPAEVVTRRLEELLSLQRGLTLDYNRSRVGRATRILVEGPSRRAGGQLRGRDPYLRVVNIDPAPGAALAVGTFVDVDIVDATPHSLVGEACGERAHSRALTSDLRVLA
jgi:tRNA-2-methylthio-N6-dimethylallyladenosine synthase